MFTGIVEETGEIVSRTPRGDGLVLEVRASVVSGDLKLGDSLAVNGCCLTATRIEGELLRFDLLGETLAKTNLGAVDAGARVNLERPLAANGRLGGHFVQGHVDCTAPVIALEPVGGDFCLSVALPAEFAKYAAYKGSIAVNGVSLTVAELRDDRILIYLIPHTLEATNLGALKPGDSVNLEFDMLAKYLERLVAASR